MIMNNNAYVTFLGGDGDYVKGVVCLAKGLRKVTSAFPLVVALLPDVPPDHRRLLLDQGCILRDVQPVTLPLTATSAYVRPYFALNYTKLRLWQFVEYDKMIYMDADVQVFQNIDNLFDLCQADESSFFGVVDCLCEMYGPPCPRRVPWPVQLGNPPSFYFNAGLFLFRPHLGVYNRLLNLLQLTPPTPFAEQDFLNMFFRESSKPIPPAYNLLIAMVWRHPEWVELSKVKVVHYCVNGSKPWRYTGKEENMDRADVKMLVNKWWDIYNDHELDFTSAKPRKLTPALAPDVVSVRHIPAPSAA